MRTVRATLIAVLATLAIAATALLAGAQETGAPPQEPCFGAASRDFLKPCRNPRLRTTVYPTPRQAKVLPEGPCQKLIRLRLQPCAFGVPAGEAQEGMALIGDSHAIHWRAALDHVAKRRRWKAYSFARDGCPLSAATKYQSPGKKRACLIYRRRVVRWVKRHPEIRTVVVSNLTGDASVEGSGDQFELQVRGFTRAWRWLPETVRRIIVIRDTPRSLATAPRCVMRATRRGKPPGTTCAAPRKRLMWRDPAATAAERLGTSRFHVIDMTRWFCDRGKCFPVIGGALVHQDQTHQTATWNATLGPYLLRAMNRLD